MGVRRVQESDVEAVVALVHELAAYERASDQCRLTSAQLRTALFGEQPALFGHVAVIDGEVAGFAFGPNTGERDWAGNCWPRSPRSV